MFILKSIKGQINTKITKYQNKSQQKHLIKQRFINKNIVQTHVHIPCNWNVKENYIRKP